MRAALDNVVQDFIVSNGKIAQSYFDLSGKIIDSLCDTHESRESVLMRLLEQAQTVTSHYLDAHRQVVQSLYLNQHSPAVRLVTAPVAPPTVVSSVPAPQAAANSPLPEPQASPQQWLRDEISALIGQPSAAIDLGQRFDALGLDSLSRVDLFDAMAKAFPEACEHASAFFDLATPAAVLAMLQAQPAPQAAATHGEQPDDQDVHTRVMAHLASITGFAIGDLDPRQAYEEQGLDSLIRLDFLDLLSQQWPRLKAHESALTDSRCAQQTIEQIKALLRDDTRPPLPGHDTLLAEAMTPLLSTTAATDSTQPFAELGLNGFDRAALCQNMAQACKTSAFAGEALMSRRNSSETLDLLARMS